MAHLACWSCGRSLYTTSPLESLFPDERRCPRCGAYLQRERRESDRRGEIRRDNPMDEPGPPMATGERRAEQRREGQRRGTGASGAGDARAGGGHGRAAP
jgi:hypothetical protein